MVGFALVWKCDVKDENISRYFRRLLDFLLPPVSPFAAVITQPVALRFTGLLAGLGLAKNLRRKMLTSLDYWLK
jgi:hypothetical protein